MTLCRTCGAVPYRYSTSFIILWMTARAWHPIPALPEPDQCWQCIQEKMEWWSRIRHLPPQHPDRKAWLRSSTPIPILDVTNPEVRRSLRAGANAAKRYRKELQRERERERNRWMRQQLRKLRRAEKKRQRAIREVLERAVEIAFEDERDGACP